MNIQGDAKELLIPKDPTNILRNNSKNASDKIPVQIDRKLNDTEYDRSEFNLLRRYIVICFTITVLLCLPIWHYLTRVYRAPLPYDEIAYLEHHRVWFTCLNLQYS